MDPQQRSIPIMLRLERALYRHADIVGQLRAMSKLMQRSSAVAGLVGIKCGVVSGVFNLESSGVEGPDWRPRHGKQYHAF